MNSRNAKDVFLDAIDLPLDRQDAFVLEACGMDGALRANVLSLLQTHRSRPDVLNRPAADLDRSWSNAQESSPHRRAEQIGDLIDRYRLVRLLGEGGFGAVYLAQQVEPLTREVALKVIRRGMDTDQIIARFEMERQALAMMDHPGVARVLDAGATTSGRPYFVMEYVNGVPITDYCRQHQLNIAQRLELIEQAALAVHHAHQKGIIHRDLKPGNILVTQVDEKPIPKIIDFGIAKIMQTDDVAVTREMQVVGTPQYMSPEQAAGSASRIDTRSDVYSLGTVLYELVTRSPPFDPEALRHAPIGAVAQIIREQTPIKPSKRALESRQLAGDSPASRILSYQRQFPAEIDWIVMKALEKEPARRYSSASELAADIRRHLSDKPVLAGPPSQLYAVRKFARRHRASLAAIALMALTLVVATITSTILAARARRAEANAQRQTQRALEELARANAIVGFTGDLLEGIGPSVARGRDTTLLHEILDNSIQKASENLKDQPAIELTVRNVYANALYDLGDSKAAIAQLRQIYDATANSPLRDHPQRLKAAALMATMLLDGNDLFEAEKYVNESLEGFHRIGLDDSDDAYLARLAQAAVDLFSGRAAVAEKRFAEILQHYRAIGKGESTEALHAWNNLALAISDQGRWAEAYVIWKDIHAVERRVYGEEHPYTLETLMDIGTSLLNLKRTDEAEAIFHQTLDIARKVYPSGHPTLLINMNNLATLLFQLGRYDETDAILTEALEAGRKKLGVLDRPMDTIILQLGQLRAKQGRFDEAVKYAQELHDAIAQKLGERHMKTLSSLILVYDNLLQANRAAEGVAMVEHLGELAADLPPDLRQQLETRAGLLYLAVGNESAARKHAALARAAVQNDANGEPRVTSSLRLLESKLHIAATQAVSPKGN